MGSRLPSGRRPAEAASGFHMHEAGLGDGPTDVLICGEALSDIQREGQACPPGHSSDRRIRFGVCVSGAGSSANITSPIISMLR